MKNRGYACVLIACLLLFAGCHAAKNDTDIEDKVISETVSEDGVLAFTEYDTKVTCECDLDKDGKYEIITADYSETLKDHQLPINMTVMSDDREVILWQDPDMGLPGMGWKSYYVTVIDGSAYLMEYHPPEDRQGLYDYSLKIFTIDSNGNEVIYADINGDTKEAVDEFNTQISKYMDNAYPLISTENGNIMTSRLVLRGSE